MATLFLLNDLSNSLPWNLAAFHANRGNFAREGLLFGPLPQMGATFLPNHQQFWTARASDQPVPGWLAQRFDKTRQELDSGHDVLLFQSGIFLPGYQSLAYLLEPLQKLHSIKSIFVIGSPLCSFEQRWRYLTAIPERDRIPLARRFASLFRLVENEWHFYGKDNVSLIADRSFNPKALYNPELLQQIFAALGQKNAILSFSPPPHPLIFGSDTARRLHNARWLRMNAWPPMNEAKFREILLKCDADWGNAPLSPRQLRQMLLAESRVDQDSLEKAMQLPPGALSAPGWLVNGESITDWQPLDMDKVQSFVDALPAAIVEPLLRRINADPSLEFHAHKCLLKAIANRPEPEFRHIGEPEPPVELTVLTMTYNQEQYIAQCMESVLAQKTDFPLRHLVLDHCSSDATPQIIARYAVRHPSIKPVLLPTRWQGENVRGLFMRCKSKYAALCDGDDYFSDPLKLQKQVAFLEASPHCALVFHPVRVCYEEQPEKEFVFPPADMLPGGPKREYELRDLFKGNFIQTNSVLYRWRFASGLPPWFRAGLCPGDWYWHLLHAETGKIGYLQEVMSVYRRHAKALYEHGFQDAKAHRRANGMKELETFAAIDKHFDGRYFQDIASLADGVFANFLELFIDGDSSMLDEACQKYPRFGNNFLKKLNI